MSTNTHPTRSSTLGRCPDCAATVSTFDVLIEYETDEGCAVWAACPDCGEVVHPA